MNKILIKGRWERQTQRVKGKCSVEKKIRRKEEKIKMEW